MQDLVKSSVNAFSQVQSELVSLKDHVNRIRFQGNLFTLIDLDCVKE